MRILFSAALQPSHFFPLVPLAWALHAAGHEVRVAHQPRLTPFVQGAGLSSVVVGSDTEIDANQRIKAQRAQQTTRKAGEPDHGGSTRPTAEANREHIRIALSLFSDAASRMIDGLLEFGRHWRPDLIIFEWQSYGAHLAAEVLGVPSVRHQFSGPDFEVGIPGWRDMERDELLPMYEKQGIPTVRPDGAATIDPCPPALQFELPDRHRYLPVRYIPYNGSATAEPWTYRKAERPRIALTVGSSYLWMTGNLSPVRTFIDAAAEEDLEIIAAVPRGGRQLLGPTAPQVRIVENVPLELFLPTCDAIINHGGTGTVGTSLAHGLPQVITPPAAMGDPPFHNAERIVRAGAGLQVDVFRDSPRQLVDSVRTVTSEPSFRTSARALAAQERTRPLPAEVIPQLEELARGTRTH